jgi:iron complex transport system permease protein
VIATRREAPARPGRRALVLGLAGLVAALLVVSALSIAFGARSVGLGEVVDALRDHQPGNDDHQVVVNRIPRLLAGLLVGAALGLAGAIMQGVARNPLADPGLLGINAGAAFAVVCATGLLGITAATGYVWFAFAGAAVVAVLVYAVGSLGRDGATPVKLTLAGAAIGGVLTSLTTAVLLADATTFDQYRFWTVGSLTGRRLDLVAQLAPFLLVGVAVALGTGRMLNALALGDDVARGLGQRVAVARATCFAAAVVLCGAATAIAGPVWFIGLVVPHIARVVTGPDYRWILPYSMLIAPVLLVLSDVVGRLLAPPGEVQVGIVLAFLGAPFLIALVRRQRLAAL